MLSSTCRVSLQPYPHPTISPPTSPFPTHSGCALSDLHLSQDLDPPNTKPRANQHERPEQLEANHSLHPWRAAYLLHGSIAQRGAVDFGEELRRKNEGMVDEVVLARESTEEHADQGGVGFSEAHKGG